MPQDGPVVPEEEQDGNNSESGFLEHAEDAPEDELRKSSESLDSGWETDLEIEGKVYSENNLTCCIAKCMYVFVFQSHLTMTLK